MLEGQLIHDAGKLKEVNYLKKYIFIMIELWWRENLITIMIR